MRNAVLALLGEQELNGYGLINAIAEKSNGLWRPSAGSIYPALGLLEEHMGHCLVEAARAGGAEQDAKIREASDAIARLVRS